jgi:hypothetical protein
VHRQRDSVFSVSRITISVDRLREQCGPLRRLSFGRGGRHPATPGGCAYGVESPRVIGCTTSMRSSHGGLTATTLKVQWRLHRTQTAGLRPSWLVATGTCITVGKPRSRRSARAGVVSRSRFSAGLFATARTSGQKYRRRMHSCAHCLRDMKLPVFKPARRSAVISAAHLIRGDA